MLQLSDVNPQVLGGLGWRELILMAAIVLTLVGASRPKVFRREEDLDEAESAPSGGPRRASLSLATRQRPAVRRTARRAGAVARRRAS